HGPPTVLPSGDDSLKRSVGQWMVFNLNGQPLLARSNVGPLGHGPTQQDACVLKSQVIMQMGGSMLLHDKHGTCGASRSTITRGLWCAAEIALVAVFFQSHGRASSARRAIQQPP